MADVAPPVSFLVPEIDTPFSEEARRAIYEVIALRRDIRHFRTDDVGEDVLRRILGAAHLAPSVGFSQPWHFVVVRDRRKRGRIRESFLRCRAAEAARFPADQREAYLAHKLEGILDAPVNVCIVVDLRDRDGAILGTTAQPDAVRASACCAVENLWLAARAEEIGVGWVSIVEPAVLRAELALPSGIEPIAYLCVGRPVAFRRRPMLEETGWERRRSVDDAIHRERFPPGPQVPARPLPSLPREVMPFDEDARAAALVHQMTLVKPHGSLGRLEELAAHYAGARGRFPTPVPERMALAIFAADHGVVAEGVSAYGSQSTAAMVAAVMAGGAAINAIAARHDIELALVDVGVVGDLGGAPQEPVVSLLRKKIAAGTRNLLHECALTTDEVAAAMAVGREVAEAHVGAGAALLGVGEIGIGNTTSAAALIAAFTGASPDDIVGRGTGIDDATLARKRATVAEALARHTPDAKDVVGTLAALGGLEICAMAGFIHEAARLRMPVVLDGFVAYAAALAVRAFDARTTAYLIASHRSAEHGSPVALRALELEPVLDLRLRLGEGTGAAIAMDLVRTAVATQHAMATFATAGIVGRASTS